MSLTAREPIFLVVFELFHHVLVRGLKAFQFALQVSDALFELCVLFFLQAWLRLFLLLCLHELCVLFHRHVDV